ncbi:hypothetical protein [Phaeacidiphilus oryzae]|uniref:hypothetical protein n=1 Tax=Phaeacidiphilus oryzae TaxID=348818 RepID=UPI00056CE3DA|nr:hypothetical protein [Phaeacidiphilus oryzae]
MSTSAGAGARPTEQNKLTAARHRGGTARPQVSVGAMWWAGFAAAGFATLLALGLIMLVRGFIGLPIYQDSAGQGDSGVGPISLGFIIAMLITTLLMTVLVKAVDEPMKIYTAVVALAELAFIVVLFTVGGRTPSQIFGELFTSLVFAAMFLWFAHWIVRCGVGWAR